MAHVVVDETAAHRALQLLLHEAREPFWSTHVTRAHRECLVQVGPQKKAAKAKRKQAQARSTQDVKSLKRQRR